MALVMALVREFNSQIPIWFPHLRRRRQRRGNRDPLRLDVSRNLSSSLALSPTQAQGTVATLAMAVCAPSGCARRCAAAVGIRYRSALRIR